MYLKILLISILFSGRQCLDTESFYSYLQYSTKNSSAECAKQKSAFLRGLINGDVWAARMLEASARIPKGVTQGNTNDFGMFDQCLNIREKLDSIEIKGKYCYPGLIVPLIDINLNISRVGQNITKQIIQLAEQEVVSPRDDISEILKHILLLSTCIPDACSPSDFYGALGNDNSCQTKNETRKLTNADIAFLCFLALIICLIIGSTIYDIYLQRKSGETKFPVLLAFSFYTNGKKILKTTQQTEQILVFNGIRVLSMFWVVLGHSYGNMSYLVLNTEEATEWRRRWYAIYVMLAPLAVDTFLFLSGTLLAFTFLKTMRKPNQKFNIFLYYLHRYLRLTPAMAVMYFFYVTIARRIPAGPMQKSIDRNTEKTCLNSQIWTFFLYVQNYVVDSDKMCLLHTWYLSVDMQFYIISPVLLLPMVYYGKRVTYLVIPILILAAVVSNMLIFYFYEIHLWSDDYHRLFYYVTHTRFPPWLIGLIFGAFLTDYQSNKEKYQPKNKLLLFAIWGVVLCVIGFLFFYQDDADNNYNRIKATFFFPLQRSLWALCLCWICFACLSGNGGFLNTFLSASFFQILSKVTYSTYLIHFPILRMQMGHLRAIPYFSDIDGIRTAIADIFISYLVGTIWTLAFESPVIVFEKFIFEGDSKKKIEKSEDCSEGITPK